MHSHLFRNAVVEVTNTGKRIGSGGSGYVELAAHTAKGSRKQILDISAVKVAPRRNVRKASYVRAFPLKGGSAAISSFAISLGFIVRRFDDDRRDHVPIQSGANPRRSASTVSMMPAMSIRPLRWNHV